MKSNLKYKVKNNFSKTMKRSSMSMDVQLFAVVTPKENYSHTSAQKIYNYKNQTYCSTHLRSTNAQQTKTQSPTLDIPLIHLSVKNLNFYHVRQEWYNFKSFAELGTFHFVRTKTGSTTCWRKKWNIRLINQQSIVIWLLWMPITHKTMKILKLTRKFRVVRKHKRK